MFRLSMLRLFVFIFSIGTTFLANAQPSDPSQDPQSNTLQPPKTPIRPATDTYYGIKIIDPYRWLEDSNNPEVQKWTEEQTNYTHNVLDQLPALNKIKAQLKEWNAKRSAQYGSLVFRNNRYFALKLQPPKNQPILITLTSLDHTKTETVLLDPNTLDSSGTTAIDFFVPSLDGQYVAVSLSKDGSEIGTLHIYNVATGKELADQIPEITKPTGGGSLAWNKESTGFYYTRYPKKGERPNDELDFHQQIYFHNIGNPIARDSYSIGKEFPAIAEILLSTSPDGNSILASVANGDGGEFTHYVLNVERAKWTQISQYKDKIKYAILGLHNDVYFISTLGAPKGKVLKLSLNNPDLSKAQTIVPESVGAIETVMPTNTRLYVKDIVGGPSQVRMFDLDGKLIETLNIPPLSAVSNLTRTTGDEIVFQNQSFVSPPAFFTFSKDKLHKTALVSTSPVDFKNIEVKREFATSKDGTKIPMTIIAKRGLKRDGKNPLMLYGYGGYGVNLTPRFSSNLYLWLERGGIYVDANIRGGGEFGENWHLEGNLTKKQNVFDDFIGCAEHLIKMNYTTPAKLAIQGGSNGGLLMGAALVQRPDLFQAVVSRVGIYDMLRSELEPNGNFNITEFGTVKNRAEFDALYAYSPYFHVVNGTKYPAVLLTTGANDGRVAPSQSKKMAARLQAATASGKPILLRVNFTGGHGQGQSTEQRISEEADVYTFLFWQLGMNY